jgi:uncharacterized protein
MDDARRKRIESHRASVVQDSDGKLHTEIQLINILDGARTKKNKLVSVVPKLTETVSSFKDVPHLFADLSHLNAMLTNACNLSCSYCYEQHNKDFGRFTVDSLKKTYDWLVNVNDVPKKCFQFFGGEPLIHKKLIREFIEEHDKELEANYDNFSGTFVSMCTNGLLADDDFIDFYFSKPYTHLMLSLDTFDSAIDYREITPTQMDKLIVIMGKILAKLGDEPQRLVIRCTLSEETSGTMRDFIEKLYAIGVRSLIVHPLILDSRRGYIRWSDNNWNNMREGIFDALTKYRDLIIKFSEGVGQKDSNNCMVGSDMIAIDASGDFSGCYFFTNQKASAVADAVLGNVFEDRIYVDRYAAFQAEYNKMFETEEKCKTCDLHNFCYQCPAGNLDTGSKKMFRPDDMCQEVVKLFLDFQTDVYNKMFWRNVNIHMESYSKEYSSQVMSDLGYDPKLTPKENYELNNSPIVLEGEENFIQCFFIQTLIMTQ